MNSTLYIGLMSGTSMDAIDAALVDFSQQQVRLIDHCSLAIPHDIQQQSKALNHSALNDLENSLILDRQWGFLYAQIVNKLLKQSGICANAIRAIGSHGLTVRHAPSGQYGYTLQIGDANTIAEHTGIDVVADFRRRDVAANGQGAPLAPAFHRAIFTSSTEKRIIVNIGGMANITQLYGKQIIGFDCGPGNVLMDTWCQLHLQQAFDKNGLWAANGKVLYPLLRNMLKEPFFSLPAPKSTGRERFDMHWVRAFLSGDEKPQDVQATLAELTALTIAQAIDKQADTVYICGGGAFNLHLIRRIHALCGKKVLTTAALDIPPEHLEAMAFAYFAKQTIEAKPSNIPSVTGATGERILGAIYQAGLR